MDSIDEAEIRQKADYLKLEIELLEELIDERKEELKVLKAYIMYFDEPEIKEMVDEQWRYTQKIKNMKPIEELS